MMTWKSLTQEPYTGESGHYGSYDDEFEATRSQRHLLGHLSRTGLWEGYRGWNPAYERQRSNQENWRQQVKSFQSIDTSQPCLPTGLWDGPANKPRDVEQFEESLGHFNSAITLMTSLGVAEFANQMWPKWPALVENVGVAEKELGNMRAIGEGDSTQIDSRLLKSICDKSKQTLDDTVAAIYKVAAYRGGRHAHRSSFKSGKRFIELQRKSQYIPDST